MSVRRRGLIFGVVLLAYFGHVSVGNCGKLVLRRDPSGRSLIWGTVAAQGVAIVLYCIWVLGGHFAVIASGQLVPASVCFESPEGEQHLESASGGTPPFSSLRSVVFRLSRAGAPELKVWTHKVSPDGSSAALPVRLRVQSDEETQDLDLEVLGGQVVLPVKSDSPTTITMVNKEGRQEGDLIRCETARPS